MEPVVPARSRFEDDLKEIAQRVGAYRYAIEQAGAVRQGRLIVYVTTGGPEVFMALRTVVGHSGTHKPIIEGLPQAKIDEAVAYCRSRMLG